MSSVISRSERSFSRFFLFPIFLIEEIDLGQEYMIQRVGLKSFRKKDLETGNHSFHLLLTHLHETRGIQRKRIDQLACFLLCFPKKQKVLELRYPLDPLISSFRTHGGPVDTSNWTDNSIL